MTAIATFRRLHERGCFVMPNPWDPGSARALVALGFPAVATTSSGYAWSRGGRDNAMPLDAVLRHLREIATAVPVPVNADFEGGFAIDPGAVGRNVAVALSTGVAGLSIEDSTGDPRRPLFDPPLAVERIAAAREAIDASGTGALLTGRSEGFVAGSPDLDETIRRLVAYAEAGAECLFAPGIRTREQIAAIVEAVRPRPVNVLVGGGFARLDALAALGVRRISTGGALARAAWSGLLAAARGIAERGDFSGFDGAVASAEIEGLFPPD